MNGLVPRVVDAPPSVCRRLGRVGTALSRRAVAGIDTSTGTGVIGPSVLRREDPIGLGAPADVEEVDR